MIKKIALLLFVLSPFLSISQNKTIENFFAMHQDDEKATHITMEGWLLQMAAANLGESLEQKAVQAIQKLRILIFDQGNKVSKKDQDKLISGLKKEQFESLLSLREGTTHMELLVQEQAGAITNLLLTILEEDNYVCLNAEGSMPIEEFRKLNIDIDGNTLQQIKKYTNNNP